MSLFFDENLSHKLPGLLIRTFPESTHPRHCALTGRTDPEIWEYARAHNLIVVSKDQDFYERSLLYGAPPKVIWLRVGNCTTASLLRLLAEHVQTIRNLPRVGKNPC